MIKNQLKLLKNRLELWYTVNYRGARVKVPIQPREGQCEACGKKGHTNRHHWIYVFKKKEIEENPNLSMLYTNELCAYWPCHELANSLRKLYEFDPDLKIKSNSAIIRKLLELRENAIKTAKKDGNLTEKHLKNGTSEKQ